VAVIEWAERWFANGPNLNATTADPRWRYRRVQIETISENERRITYEDSGD
jgi:hypothetical protein